jgi:UDP-glucose 4-epimerase
MRRILVTGASTWTGGQLISRLERRPEVDVLAVDEVDPTVGFATELHHFELDRADFAHFVLAACPDTIVHLQTVDRSARLGGVRAHEEAVLGTQALFGAIQRCESIRHVIARSETVVYGMGPRNPSVVFEDAALDAGIGRFGRDLANLEEYLAQSAARRPDVTFTVLRFAGIFGPTIGNPLSRYLRLPVVPTRLGYDPRFQLISEHDAVAAIEHSIANPVPGAFNVAAPGQQYLSRILRLGKRLAQPLPRRGFDVAVRGMASFDLYLPGHVTRMIHYGLVGDIGRMQTDLGFVPEHNLRQTILAGYSDGPAPGRAAR